MGGNFVFLGLWQTEHTWGGHWRWFMHEPHSAHLCPSGVSWAQGFSLIYTSGSRPGELGFPESSASLKSPKNKFLQSWASPSTAHVPLSLAWVCTSARRFSLMFPLWDIFRWAHFSPRTAHLSLQSLTFKTEHFQMLLPNIFVAATKRVLFAFSNTEFWRVLHMQRGSKGQEA